MSHRRQVKASLVPKIEPPDLTGCTFDRETHVYAIDGIQVPSVTQILTEVGFVDFSMVPDRILEQAQARGTYVHTVLHYYLEGDFDLGDVDERFRGYIDSALQYLETATLTPLRDAGGNAIAVEYRFWDRVRRFAGTMDYVAYDPDGTIAIVDWKTGEPSDVAAPLQTAAYEYGLRQGILRNHPFPIRRRAIKLFRDGQRARVEPYDAEHGHDYQHDLGLFFSALTCVHYRRNGMRHTAA